MDLGKQCILDIKTLASDWLDVSANLENSAVGHGTRKGQISW